MKTKNEVYEFLRSLQWVRLTKKELNVKMTQFFGVEMKGEEATDMECDYDYSLIYTTGNPESTRNFVDMEIYYLKTREKRDGSKVLLITEPTLLDYQE